VLKRVFLLCSFEAMYNLGYMYLFGEGVPSPDPHLAKRYFDLSLSTNPAAFYAVSLSLLYLQLTTSPISSLVRKVNLFFWWNEGVVMAILVIVLISLLSARMARQ
jgi:TPR repeat protein